MGAEESNWSIQNHGQQPWRSPVNLIFDRTLPVIGGRPEFSEGNGGYIDRNGTGTRRIMYMVTGDVVHDSFHLIGGSEQRTLMEKGAFINYLPKHMRTKQLVRDGDSWLVVQDDQHGEYKDYAESRITDLRTWAGQRSNVQYSSTFTPKVVAEEGPVIPIQSARQQPNQYHQQGRRRGRR
jgi:hypothetical protein